MSSMKKRPGNPSRGGAPIIAKPPTTKASAASGAFAAVGRSGALRRSSVPAASSWPDADAPVTITLERADDAWPGQRRDPDKRSAEVRDHRVDDQSAQIGRAARKERAAQSRGQPDAVQKVLHLHDLDDRGEQAREREDLNEGDECRRDEDTEI